MTRIEIERHAQILENRFGLASHHRRQEMRPEVARIIRELKTQNQPIPRPLRRIEAALEAEDMDMFDNMPI
ncbi:MAG: hypothetical protein ACSHWZ_09740 [Sulfitobacter sp.]